MESLNSFLAMGGYASYIWPAYGIVTLVLVGLFVVSRRYANRTATELNALNPRAGRKRRGKHSTQMEKTGNGDET